MWRHLWSETHRDNRSSSSETVRKVAATGQVQAEPRSYGRRHQETLHFTAQECQGREGAISLQWPRSSQTNSERRDLGFQQGSLKCSTY